MRPRLQHLVGLLGRAAQNRAPDAIEIRRIEHETDEQTDAEELKRRLDETRQRLKQQIPPPKA